MRVRANSFYVYVPCMLDVCDARTDLRNGDLVQVRNLPGCPPANTMRHAHVFKDGKFAGLVSTSSLISRKDYAAQWKRAPITSAAHKLLGAPTRKS